MWIHIVPRCDTLLKALRYDTHSQEISQFYLHTPHSSVIRMSCTCLLFPAEAGPRLPTQEGWKAELAWVAGYVPR